MDSATRKKRLFWYFVIMAVYSVVSNFAHPATPTIIKNLNLHDYMFGVAFAGMSITNFLFSPFWGRISDQIGRNKVFLACGIGYGVGQAVFGMATTELGILFGRMISGFFIGGGSVVQLSYIMDYSDAEQRGKNFTLLAVIQSVSSAAGYLIGGYISEYSIPMMFVLQVISLAATGIIFAVLFKENHLERGGKGFQSLRCFCQSRQADDKGAHNTFVHHPHSQLCKHGIRPVLQLLHKRPVLLLALQ